MEKIKYITESDIVCANRYKVKEDMNLHLVSAYLKRKYAGYDITYNESKKPFSDSINFNVSHTKAAVVIGLSDEYQIGVDIEYVKEVSDELKKYISSDLELSRIKNDLDFFKVWTSKESLVKCEGKGLTKAIKEIPSIFSDENKYLDIEFRTKTFVHMNYVISVTINQNIDFDIEMEREEVEV